MVHIHVREESTSRPVADLDLFERVLTELSEHTDAVLQPTTGGGRGMTARPEIEVHDVGQIFNLRRLVADGVLEPPFNLQFVLGVLGANAAEPDQLIHMLRTAERVLGRESFTWSAAGVGYRGEFGLRPATPGEGRRQLRLR